tara:strand:+ start:7510 stop:7722 length:213 start_codon:yes stop_codon:yes gene_type:complete
VQLETLGIPTVVVTTREFRSLTDQVAASLGHPDLRILEVGHPLGGTKEETILEWADDAVEATIQLLTGAV